MTSKYTQKVRTQEDLLSLKKNMAETFVNLQILETEIICHFPLS